MSASCGSKLERQLASSDRFKADSAGQLEESNSALRREFEAATRKREAEVARAQKEAHDQLEAAQAEKAKLAAELQETRARLEAVPAPSASPQEWEARAVSQLEADIESYRGRIKTLLQEKNAIASEKEKLAAQLASAPAVEKPAEDRFGIMAATLQKLRDELAAAQAEREGHAAHARDLEQKLADAETARAAIGRRVHKSGIDPEKLAQAEAARKTAEDSLAQLWKENEELAKKVADAENARAAAEENRKKAEQAEAARKAAEESAGPGSCRKGPHREGTRSGVCCCALAASAAAASQQGPAEEAARLARELESARAASNESITQLRSEVKKLTVERDAALKEGETLLAEADALKAQHDEEKEQLIGVHSAAGEKLAQEHGAASTALRELQAAHERLLAEKISLAEELKAALAKADALTAQHQQEGAIDRRPFGSGRKARARARRHFERTR